MAAEDILQALEGLRDSFDGRVNVEELVKEIFLGKDSQYMGEFHADFKANYFLPFTDKLKKVYSTINQKLDTIKGTTIDKLTDPFGLSNINKEYEDAIKKYKSNMEKFLNRKFESTEESPKNTLNLKQNKAGKYVDENNRFVSNEVRDQFLAQQAAPKPAENLTKVSQPIQNIIPDSVKNTNPSQALDQEQKNFGPQEVLINFSRGGKEFITQLLDDEFKKLPKSSVSINNTKEDKNSPTWILASLILGLISDAILLTKKLGAAFEVLIKNPITRLMGVLEDEGLYKFADYKAWFELRWEKYIWEPLKSKFPNFEELGNKFENFGTRVGKLKNSIVEGLKLDDLGAWISLRFEANIKNPIINEFNSMIKDFSEGGRMAWLSNIWNNIIKSIEQVKGPIGWFVETFPTAARAIGGLSKIFGGLFSFVAEKFPFIDATFNAIKTTIDLWGDKTLSPLQKGIAIVTSFLGGFADFLLSIPSLLAKGISGIVGFITGKGFLASTDNAFSKWIDNTFRADGRGAGVAAGSAVANLEREINKPSQAGFFNDILAGIGIKTKAFNEGGVNLTPYGQEAANAQQQGQPIPTEDGEISATKIVGADGKVYEPNPQKDTVFATKSDGDFIKTIQMLNKQILSLGDKIAQMQNNSQSSNNISSVNVTANNSSGKSSPDHIHRMRVGHYMLTDRGGLYA